MGKTKISDNKTLDRVYTATNYQELMSAYGDWAKQYENDTVGAFGYVAHIATAKALTDVVDDKDSLILDAGCGTGLVGEQLVEHGYTNLEALDYSAEMLKEAEGKNIYSRHIQADLSKPLDIPNNKYDAIVCTGTFTYGHVTPDGFDELVRITKPGGTICFTVREGAYEDHGYGERLEKLESDNIWKLLNKFDTDYLKEENVSCKMCVYRVCAE
ncbi:class I SAM-dependent methyltransferase [Desulforhopalus vacuolatus]|uniref:class I SAM-dependent DNA methyltransferase n=1 Tax=Desulforhopalus vacuolatus TaxID=40414 RepID=UPI00196637B8|nr:class I SAM-dependent methyltransferase [Desulforhopalus vacuolatus]MBM9520228.1 class I SAM-dependent methyltransferase [Desulforhopalus vacuolatus]